MQNSNFSKKNHVLGLKSVTAR